MAAVLTLLGLAVAWLLLIVLVAVGTAHIWH